MLCVLYSETSGASRDIIWRGSWTNMFVSLSRQSLLLHSCLTCIRCLQSTPFRDNTVQVTETVSYYVFSLYHNAASYTKCFSHTIHTSLYWHVDILTNNARLHEVQNISLPVVTRTQQNSTIYDYFRRPSFVKIRLVLGNIPEHVTQGKYARWGAYHKIFHYIYIYYVCKIWAVVTTVILLHRGIGNSFLFTRTSIIIDLINIQSPALRISGVRP